MVIESFLVYVVIAIVFTIIEYKEVKRKCSILNTPKLDYCLIRGFFFPLVIIKKVYEYIIKSE